MARRRHEQNDPAAATAAAAPRKRVLASVSRILALSLGVVFGVAALPSLMGLLYLRELARSPESAEHARAERIQHDLTRIHALGLELAAVARTCDDAARVGEIITALGERRVSLLGLVTHPATSGPGDAAGAPATSSPVRALADANPYLADVVQRIGTLRYLAPEAGAVTGGDLPAGRCEALRSEVASLNQVAGLGAGAFTRAAEMAGREAALRALRNTALGLVLALVVAIAVGVWATRRIRRPLGVLGRILHQAADGNYNVAVVRTGLHEADALAGGLGRTLGRLRVFDTLKTKRVREERRMVDALLAASDGEIGVALVNPAAIVSQANATFRSQLGIESDDCEGHRIDEVLGPDALELLKRVQHEKTDDQFTWTNGSGPEGDPLSVRLIPVKDEGHGLPRVIVLVSAPSRS